MILVGGHPFPGNPPGAKSGTDSPQERAMRCRNDLPLYQSLRLPAISASPFRVLFLIRLDPGSWYCFDQLCLTGQALPHPLFSHFLSPLRIGNVCYSNRPSRVCQVELQDFWSDRRDSDPRPSHPQRDALPS
jgi:hypothetical protein